MRVVNEYTVLWLDEQEIEMPAGAEILCVQHKAGFPVLSALSDPDEKDRHFRKVRILPIGQAMQGYKASSFVGMLHMQDEPDVYVFVK